MNLCFACREALVGDSWRCARCGFTPERSENVISLISGGERIHFSNDIFTDLDAVEKGHFWFEERRKILVSALRRHCPGFKSYLEVGCGGGFVLEKIAQIFSGARLHGAEYFPDALRLAARRLPTIRFYRLDLLNMPFVDEFDVIGMYDVLEHVEDDMRALRSVRAALTPGGLLLITVPQHRWLWSSTDDAARHQRRYTRDELIEKAGETGFEVVAATSFVTTLLPAMLLSRWLNRDKPPSSAELRPSRPINALFSRLMAVDRLLINMGCPLPMGGSLLCVFRAKG